MSPSKVRDAVVCTEPVVRHRAPGSLTWSWLLCRVLFVSSYRRSWVTPLPSLPRHFGRTAMVFRRYRPPSSMKKAGSSSRELGSPPEFVVPTSARASMPHSRATCDHGRLPWGLLPLRDLSPASPLFDEHPRLAFVPPSAFHALSAVSSSQCLAGLFHPAATSRLRAPGGSSPDPAGAPRRCPVPPRRWSRPPVAGCPTTPAVVTSTSRS